MKKIWAIRKDAEAVSPVIATILMVAITVVLAAVLYVMVLGFGGGGANTPTATYVDGTATGGRQITILSIQASDPVSWDAVKIQAKSGTTFWTWEPLKADLDDGPGDSMNYSSTGTPLLWCVVVDIGGDGFVSGSDYFVLTGGFVDNTQYQAYLLFEDTNSMIGTGSTWTA